MCLGPLPPTPRKAVITEPDVLRCCWGFFFFFFFLAIVEKSFFTYSSDLNLLGCACRKLLEATSSHVSLSSCHLPWRGSGHLFSAAARDDTAPSAFPCRHPHPLCCAPDEPSGHLPIESRKEFYQPRAGLSGGECLRLPGTEGHESTWPYPATWLDPLSPTLILALVGLSLLRKIRFLCRTKKNGA